MDNRTRTAFRAFMALCGVIGVMAGGIIVAIVGFEIGTIAGGMIVSLLGVTGLSLIIGLATFGIAGMVYARAQGWL